MSDKNKLSPVMQQYVDMKAENPDALLMFRLGDFYEAFFEDAKTVSETLNLVLTHRGTDTTGEQAPMCGIPWHAAENYFGRLVKSGFNVALVEQMETPAEAKQRGHKFIERKVIRVLTPGTITDDNLLTPKKSNFLIAIIPHEKYCDLIGCDISTGELFIGKTNNVFDDLNKINPAEIIYPELLAENNIIVSLRDSYKTTPVHNKLFIRTDINQITTQLFGDSINYDFCSEEVVELLAGYLFNTQREANLSFRTPYIFKSGKQLLIDSSTWKSLEIDAPMNDNGNCLLDVLDKTKTAYGARKLRSYLRTLTGDIEVIKERQNHIDYLLQRPKLVNDISNTLAQITDVNRSLSRLLSNRGTPKDLRSTYEFMTLLPQIKNLGIQLDDTFSSKFNNINTHDDLTYELQIALVEELPTFFRDGNIIKTGYDSNLDHMRELSNGAMGTIAQLQSKYISCTGINTLKIKYNNILGYFIEVPASRADTLLKPDSGFIHRQTMAGNVRFTTEQLIELDNDVRSASEKSFAIESEIVNNLIEQIRCVSEDLMCTADLIADVDVWYSLATVADLYNWIKPEITTGTEFEIIGGRHPVIEHVLRLHGDKFVKNDCDLNNKSIALLTGPNMAGKSTYLRQNALLVILAHLGSFVPATSAKIGVCDQLFSRVGASDNLAAGQSTFMVEMVETSNILNHASKQSFIIFDEIGRGTSTFDGMAIAQAVLEFLNKLQPRTLFATHYHELTKLVNKDNLTNVTCLTIDVREHNNDIVFLHKIIEGTANRSYGIAVAKMAGMPKDIVNRAEQVLLELETAQGYKTKSTLSVKPVSKNMDNSQLALFE